MQSVSLYSRDICEAVKDGTAEAALSLKVCTVIASDKQRYVGAEACWSCSWVLRGDDGIK